MLKTTTLCATMILLAACGGDAADETADAGMAGDTAGAGMAEAPPAQMMSATASLSDAQGNAVGTATLEEGEAGVRINLQFTGLPAGTHGFHVHQVGDCTAPTFETAGGHFNPTSMQHGLDNPQGPHAGDMQNIEVGTDGTASLAFDNDRITLSQGANSVLDADGSALVVHAGPDDNMTDPSGNSGDRIACGVITAE